MTDGTGQNKKVPYKVVVWDSFKSVKYNSQRVKSAP